MNWHDKLSISTCYPAPGFEMSVTKWLRCWGWEIDTAPSAVLQMDGSRITALPGGAFLAKGEAPDRVVAKRQAEAAWAALAAATA